MFCVKCVHIISVRLTEKLLHVNVIMGTFTGNTIFLGAQTLVSQPCIYGAFLQLDFKGLFMAQIQQST